MTQRLTKLDHTLTLVHALTGSIEGLTLDEMADLLGVTRRTVERMRNLILVHFDLDEVLDGRQKRFRIKDSPGRAYSRPSTHEVAALEAVVDAGRRDGTANARALATCSPRSRSPSTVMAAVASTTIWTC
jgi:predicted DNA-binding transcriptional regulator YafY